MELQHSQTWKNLQTAFSGELHACAKYKIYALRAREDGYEQMGNIFDETSRNEQEHAEIWLKHLSGGEVPGTLENLRDAAAGNTMNGPRCMPNFARVPPAVKALRSWRNCSPAWGTLKKRMNSVTTSWLQH